MKLSTVRDLPENVGFVPDGGHRWYAAHAGNNAPSQINAFTG